MLSRHDGSTNTRDQFIKKCAQISLLELFLVRVNGSPTEASLIMFCTQFSGDMKENRRAVSGR